VFVSLVYFLLYSVNICFIRFFYQGDLLWTQHQHRSSIYFNDLEERTTVDRINKQTVYGIISSAMKTDIDYQDRIIVDPEIMVGKPVIKGTRIPVELVLERLEETTDTTLLFEDYPQLTNEDIKACLWYAKELVKGEQVYPTSLSHTA
jgi:uncharacterized protein (DUF433 family)